MCFVPAKGKEVHSGNIEAVSTKEKAKFPQDFFPEVRLHCNRYFSIYESHLKKNAQIAVPTE